MQPIELPPYPTNLSEWLIHCERIHPQTIDMGLERVARVAQRMALSMPCPVITVAGTNGKGSTCAMLDAIYSQSGFRTGVYTSPHLVHFEERCRVEGESVNAADLLPGFAEVEEARLGKTAPDGQGEISLTYFEFTTLAILRTLARRSLDVVILEIGLGGRLDAVNVIDPDVSVITCIALDHMALLGPDRESIGREKAGIMRRGRPVVVGDPMPPGSVMAVAREVGADLRILGRDFSFSGDKQQWAWRGSLKRFNALAYPSLRGANQLLNASAALAAFEALHDRLPVSAQAVRNGLAYVDLPGRFQIVPGQPTMVLDVAHNPHAVAALAQNLDNMGFFPRTHAVFGAMADKDLDAILKRMAPLVDHWHFTDLPLPRAATAQSLQELHGHLAMPGPGLARAEVSCHSAPEIALRIALQKADPADRILVFGSFLTVGGILKQGLPKLAAKHMG